ncbi:MAG: heme exporter protein CcmD [Xanthobacteraceae bacterium]
MMDLGPHAAFIVSAYAVALAIVAGLVLWVALDRHRLKGMLNDLERGGVARRSRRAEKEFR